MQQKGRDRRPGAPKVREGSPPLQKANIGTIVALGPQEKHDALIRLEGVSEAIVSLKEFARERLLVKRVNP